MQYRLLTEEDVLKAGLGDDFHLNITETARRVFRGLKRVRFLNKLRTTVSLMKQVKEHYRHYPTTPQDFEIWRNRTEALFKEARLRLGH
jgi:hypothetical protein